MTASPNCNGRDGGARIEKIRGIIRNANRDRPSLSPRGTTNVRTALKTIRAAPSSPRTKTSSCTAITPAGYRPGAPTKPRERPLLQRGCEQGHPADLPTATVIPEDGATRPVPLRAPRVRQEVRHALGNPRDSARAMGPRPHWEHRRWTHPPAPGPGRDRPRGPAPAGSQLGLT